MVVGIIISASAALGVSWPWFLGLGLFSLERHMLHARDSGQQAPASQFPPGVSTPPLLDLGFGDIKHPGQGTTVSGWPLKAQGADSSRFYRFHHFLRQDSLPSLHLTPHPGEYSLVALLHW